MNEILSIKDFKVFQPPTEQVLLNIESLSFQSAEITTIMGASGSGKSCFLKSLAGLIPFSGELKFHEKRFDWQNPAWFRSKVMYLAQDPQFLPDTLEENLRWPFTWKIHRQKSFSQDLVKEYLDVLGWQKERLQFPIRDFSGGEKQVAQILRSLLLSPEALLLDEPTSSLDDETRKKIEDLLVNWSKERGSCLIWITHQKAQTAGVADRLLTLENRALNEKTVHAS